MVNLHSMLSEIYDLVKTFFMLKTKTAIAYLNTWEISGSISSNIDVANIIS